MGEEVSEFVRPEDVERQRHGIKQARDRAGCQLSEERLDLGECHLDRVEIRRIGRKVSKLRSGCLDGLSDTGDLMRGKVIHHHDVAGDKRRRQHLPNVDKESLAIHRAVEKPRRDDAVDPQTSGEGGGLPMAVWNGGPAAFPTLGASTKPCHLRVQAAFVDEDQLPRIEIELRLEPGSARGQDVVALLLRGVRSLFFHVMPRFLKNLEISD